MLWLQAQTGVRRISPVSFALDAAVERRKASISVPSGIRPKRTR
jgi:hypothetical protein